MRMFKLPWGHYCGICGTRMARFPQKRTPSGRPVYTQYLCPRENQHTAIQNMAYGEEMRRRGGRRPGVNRNRRRDSRGRLH